MKIFNTKAEAIAYINEREMHNSHLLGGMRQLDDGRYSVSFIWIK